VGGGFRRSFTVPARSDAFVRSTVFAGTATHRLLFGSAAIDVKAASNAVYSDSRSIPAP
jgi:hypothetical protein